MSDARPTTGPEVETPDSHPELPLDPDVGTAETPGPRPRPRPAHLTPANIALVAVGGALGTGLRLLLEQTVPRWAGVPVVTVAINVVGAFLLGALLEVVAGPALPERWSRRVRLGLGTGALGGFTTYSSLANDTAQLIGGDHAGHAVAYALGTVALGLAASVAGIRVGRQTFRREGAAAVGDAR